PLYQETGDEETKVRHANTLGSVLQCIFQFDPDSDFTQQPFEFRSDGPANVARRDLDRLDARPADSDGADDEVQCVGESVQELALISTLCEQIGRASCRERE